MEPRRPAGARARFGARRKVLRVDKRHTCSLTAVDLPANVSKMAGISDWRKKMKARSESGEWGNLGAGTTKASQGSDPLRRTVGKVGGEGGGHTVRRTNRDYDKPVPIPTKMAYVPMIRESEVARERRERRAKSDGMKDAYLGSDSSSGGQGGGFASLAGGGVGSGGSTPAAANGKLGGGTIAGAAAGGKKGKQNFAEIEENFTASADFALGKTKFKKDEDIAMEVMMEVDEEELRALKQRFRDRGGDLNLTEFVDLMLAYVPHSPQHRLTLVRNLCELFAQIDINGDGSLEVRV